MTTDDNRGIDEPSYDAGSRAAWRTMLAECLRQLGYDDPETQKAKWILEREDVISHLRSLCAEFGDNEWDDSLHLADVIDGHLADYLRR